MLERYQCQPKRSGQHGIRLLYTRTSPTTQLVRQKQVFIRIYPPATELHVVYFSSGSRTQTDYFLGLKMLQLCSAEIISCKSTVLHISYPQVGQKIDLALKETLLGFIDILLETFHFEQLFTHSFLKVYLVLQIHALPQIYKYLSGI